MKQIRKMDETGQALVEFALVIPVLLLVVMAIIEFSWYFTTRYNIDQFSRELGYNLKSPNNLSWHSSAEPRDWNTSGKPPWLSAEEQALWSYDDFKGWYEIGTVEFTNGCTPPKRDWDPDQPWDETLTPWERYGVATLDGFYFESRLRNLNINLDMKSLKTTLNGGWFINDGAMDIPAASGSWKSKRTSARTAFYHTDVIVSMEYEYKPLTPVGSLFLCQPGKSSATLTSERHYRYAFTGYTSN